jgi:drug/metabolite transporter (DMT)-like permease
MKKYLGESVLLFNTIIWGATFVIIKNALYDVSPMIFVAIRFTFASLMLLPFMSKNLRESNKATILGGTILGVMYFLGFATQTIGLNFTSATKSGFITGTFVLFTPIFQLLFEKKKPNKGNLLGVMIVLLGLVLLSGKGNSFFDIFHELGQGFNIGDFFTILCAVFFAMYLVYLDIVTRRFDYKPLVFLQVSVTGISGIVFAIILSITKFEPAKFTVNLNVIFALLYTAILATIVTTTLQTKFQKIISPTKAGIILSFEPIFSAILANIYLSEKISSFGFIGGILIFTGLIVSELFDRLKFNNNGD